MTWSIREQKDVTASSGVLLKTVCFTKDITFDSSARKIKTLELNSSHLDAYSLRVSFDDEASYDQLKKETDSIGLKSSDDSYDEGKNTLIFECDHVHFVENGLKLLNAMEVVDSTCSEIKDRAKAGLENLAQGFSLENCKETFFARLKRTDTTKVAHYYIYQLTELLIRQNERMLWYKAREALQTLINWHIARGEDRDVSSNTVNRREIHLAYLKHAITCKIEATGCTEKAKSNIQKMALDFLISLADQMVKDRINTIPENPTEGEYVKFFGQHANPTVATVMPKIRYVVQDIVYLKDGCWQFRDERTLHNIDSINTLEMTSLLARHELCLTDPVTARKESIIPLALALFSNAQGLYSISTAERSPSYERPAP